MSKRLDLTEGSILEKLLKLSLLIMGTSFIQMAYNMTDMHLVGKMGSDAVTSIIKGILLFTIFMFLFKTKKLYKVHK